MNHAAPGWTPTMNDLESSRIAMLMKDVGVIFSGRYRLVLLRLGAILT